MQCWLTCVVGHSAPTPPPLPQCMHNTNIFSGFHGDINRYVGYGGYQSLAAIVGWLYIGGGKQTRKEYLYALMCLCSRVQNTRKPEATQKNVYIYCVYIAMYT